MVMVGEGIGGIKSDTQDSTTQYLYMIKLMSPKLEFPSTVKGSSDSKGADED